MFILQSKIDTQVFRRTCVNLCYITLEIVLICVIMKRVSFWYSQLLSLLCHQLMGSSKFSSKSRQSSFAPMFASTFIIGTDNLLGIGSDKKEGCGNMKKKRSEGGVKV